MRKIGLVGGMSIESSDDYQKIITRLVKEALGNNHSPNYALEAKDFAQITRYMNQGEWNIVLTEILEMVDNLLQSNCKVIGICTNTMHRFKKEVTQAIKEKNTRDILPLEDASHHVPARFVDIRESVAKEIQKDGFRNVGLIGTLPTMSSGLYEEIMNPLGIKIVTPKKEDQDYIHETIFNKLIVGEFKDFDKIAFQLIMDSLDCPGVILGCTEIPKLMNMSSFDRKHDGFPVKLYDTTYLHCKDLVSTSFQ